MDEEKLNGILIKQEEALKMIDWIRYKMDDITGRINSGQEITDIELIALGNALSKLAFI